MPKTSPAVDAYIAAAAPFARPILKKLRQLFHKACPKVEEVMKWSTPFFVHQGTLGGIAGFKQHVNLVLWRAKELPDPQTFFKGAGITSMAPCKLRSLDEMPSDALLLRYLKAAVALNEAGPAKPRKKAAKRPPPKVPTDFRAALDRSPKAKQAFDALSPSHQREYVEWITQAKQQATRERRIATALEWLTEGKSRNWKYEKR
jgi:uncharacterized protein YdeI (YjbR/CyaY-like superfamily)